MSHLSSSSSSVSFVDPFISSLSSLSYYSSTPSQYVTPFATHVVDPDHHHHRSATNDPNKDCFFYSSSLRSGHQFLMCNNSSAAIFSTSSTSSSSPSSSSYSGDYVDFNSSPIRRVFSTGDLQGMNNGLQTSLKESAQANETGTVPCKVGRYSAEERKERIQRYRSKRHQRNFQKKITYACRKTLADSRPRVKGRFARNGENEAETETETESEYSGISYENFGYNTNYNCNVNVLYSQSVLQQDCYNYNNCIDNAGNTGNIGNTGTARDWNDHDQEELSYEEEVFFWPNMFDVLPMNMLS